MIPFASCMCFRKSRYRDWQLYPNDPERRGGVAFERTASGVYSLSMSEEISGAYGRSASWEMATRGAGVTQAERALLEALDTSDDRHRHTGRFLTLHRRRRRKQWRGPGDRECMLLTDDIYNGQAKKIIDDIDNWDFNAFLFDSNTGGHSLPWLLVSLFQKYNLIQQFNLDIVKIWKLFNLIEENYHSNNPYHNAIHASDVTQAMHCFLLERKIADHITPMEVMSALIAAVTHDLDHPGVNQPFLIATSNHLAALYKNSSVLENHHWRSAISCLQESGLFDHLDKDTREDIELNIRSLILSTDITRQQEFLGRFKRYMDTGVLAMDDIYYRHFILQIALKCADICNPCRPWEISSRWSHKVCEEFFRQGDFERKLNIPVTSMCDRHGTTVSKIQAGFFRFVVCPLFNEWNRFQRTPMSSKLMYYLISNQDHWDKAVKDENEKIPQVEEASTSEQEEAPAPTVPRVRVRVDPDADEEERLRDLQRGRRYSVPLNLSSTSTTTMRQESVSRPPRPPGVVAASRTWRAISAENLAPDPRITSISAKASQVSSLFSTHPTGGRRELMKHATFPPLMSRPRLERQSSVLGESERIRSQSQDPLIPELTPIQQEARRRLSYHPSSSLAPPPQSSSNEDSSHGEDTDQSEESPCGQDGSYQERRDSSSSQCSGEGNVGGGGSGGVAAQHIQPQVAQQKESGGGGGGQSATDGGGNSNKKHCDNRTLSRLKSESDINRAEEPPPPIRHHNYYYDKENIMPPRDVIGSKRGWRGGKRAKSEDQSDYDEPSFYVIQKRGLSHVQNRGFVRRGSAPVGLIKQEDFAFKAEMYSAVNNQEGQNSRRRGSLPFELLPHYAVGRLDNNQMCSPLRRSSLPTEQSIRPERRTSLEICLGRSGWARRSFGGGDLPSDLEEISLSSEDGRSRVNSIDNQAARKFRMRHSSLIDGGDEFESVPRFQLLLCRRRGSVPIEACLLSLEDPAE